VIIRRQILLALMLCLGVSMIFSVQNDDDKKYQDKKAIARSQHDMMSLLIEKGEYDRIPDELQKILDLNFQGKYEKYVTDEIIILSAQLSRKKQYKLCHKLVNMGLNILKEKDSLARLYKEKGALYKLTGELDKALEMFKKSVAMEGEGEDK